METKVSDAPQEPSWEKRRRIIYLSLIFCASCIMYILLKGEDTEVNEAIVTGCFLLSGGIIGSYVFGSAWQDINLRR